jgi:HEAT repeat protein
VRATAVWALGQVALVHLAEGEPSSDPVFAQLVSVLTALLGAEPTSPAGKKAAWALAEIAEQEGALPPEQLAVLAQWLAATLSMDPDVYERQFAAVHLGQLLGQLGSDAPVEALLAGLEDEKEAVRSVTLRALERCGRLVPIAPLLRALEARRGYLRAEAVRALAAQGAHGPLSVIESCLQDPEEAVRMAAAYALLQRGHEVDREIFFRGLANDRSWEVRREAGDALALLMQQGAPDILERLVVLARTPPPKWPDPGRYVRDAAVSALGGLGEEVPLAVLLDLLPEEPTSVLAALRRIDRPLPPDAIRAVRDLLGHPHAHVRVHAAHVLVDRAGTDALNPEIGAAVTEVVIPLLSGVGTNDDYQSAVQLVAQLGQWMPAQVLLSLLGESDDDDRLEAIRGLQAGHSDLVDAVVAEAQEILRGANPGPLFSSLLQWYVAGALGALPREAPGASRAVETLTALLHWPTPEVRRQAASALGYFGQVVSPTARAKLSGLREDPNRSVREAAERSLRQLTASAT